MQPQPQPLGAEEDVLGDREVRRQAEFLEDHRDAGALRVARRMERDRLAVEPDLAAGRRRAPAMMFDQGRLARAVLAEQRMHLAGAQLEVDSVQRLDAGEALAHPVRLEHDRAPVAALAASTAREISHGLGASLRGSLPADRNSTRR